MAATKFSTSVTHSINGPVLGPQLLGVVRCPQCGIASPSLVQVWKSQGTTPRTDGGLRQTWGAYQCASCGSIVTCRADSIPNSTSVVFSALFPDAKAAHEDIPEPARNKLSKRVTRPTRPR